VASFGRMRVDEIAKQVDMPLSTVYRYVQQLRTAGYLYEVDAYYTLGMRFSTGPQRRETGHLVRLAEPLLIQLRAAVGGAALLTVRVDTAALCLDRVMPQRHYRLSFQRGSVRPLYASASATPLLAFAPSEVIEEVLSGPMQRITAATPDRTKLTRELALVREQGYAVTVGEVDPDFVGVGVPVFRGAQCVCALSVVAPQSALQGEALDDAITAVLKAGKTLSARLDSVDGAIAWTPEDSS
jgi:DNA-binding IclR family transcriptional regulator